MHNLKNTSVILDNYVSLFFWTIQILQLLDKATFILSLLVLTEFYSGNCSILLCEQAKFHYMNWSIPIYSATDMYNLLYEQL
jgi:hypothetical protein